MRAQFNAVTPDFFRATGIPLLQGRSCDASDTAESPVAIVINRFLGERLWQGQRAVGRQLRSPDIPVAATVVGIVGNTRSQLLVQPITAQIYGCLSQQPGIFATVVAKQNGDPMASARSGPTGRLVGRSRSAGLEDSKRGHAGRRQRADAALRHVS